jgi:hypothetical protein
MERKAEGGAMSELREQLQQMVDEAQWPDLTIHALNGRVLMVSRALELVEVGEALVGDDTARFTVWLERGMLYKPTEAEIHERNRTAHRYEALIVRPFVLVHDHGLESAVP